MRPSEFLAVSNSPPLPDSLTDENSIEQYLVDLISHARLVAKKIDEDENDGEHRLIRLYAVRITDFPFLEFSIRIPTRHHYRLENRDLPTISLNIFNNNSVISNQFIMNN